jgi:hypothetical protein
MKIYEVRKTTGTGDFTTRMVKAHSPLQALAVTADNGGAGLSLWSNDPDRTMTATHNDGTMYGVELKICVAVDNVEVA